MFPRAHRNVAVSSVIEEVLAKIVGLIVGQAKLFTKLRKLRLEASVMNVPVDDKPFVAAQIYIRTFIIIIFTY